LPAKKIVLIIDASVGLTRDDLDMLHSLEEHQKNIIVVANKVDKIKPAKYQEQLKAIKELIGVHQIIPFSAKDKIGDVELLKEIL